VNSVALIGSLRTSGSPPIPHTTKRYRVMVAVPRRKSDGMDWWRRDDCTGTLSS